MPYAKRRTSRYTRTRKPNTGSSRGIRKYKPRRRYTKTSPQRSLWKNPLPSKGYYKFRYQDSGFTFAITSPTYFVSRMFRGNGPYDPDFTGVGTQPYGYDQYLAFPGVFGRYRCVASKIKIYPRVGGSTAEADVRALRFIVVPTTSTSPDAQEFEDLKQMPGSRSLAINSIDDQKGHLSAYWSTKRAFPEINSRDADFSAAYNSTPLRSWYWYVQADTVQSLKAITPVADVQITYYCVLGKQDDIDES